MSILRSTLRRRNLYTGLWSFSRGLTQLLNVFLPAHDAVEVALTNLFFNLARNPAVFIQLRREIFNKKENESEWTFECLKSLKYLQYVISETFRLNPPIGTNTRMVLNHTTLPTGGGSSGYNTSSIYVHKGDIITFNFCALHRRQDLFGNDADVFRPERWEALRPINWSYLPFGGGPRICPGQQLALTEVGYTVVQIIQQFKSIENRDPQLDFVENHKISTERKNGGKVTLIPAWGIWIYASCKLWATDSMALGYRYTPFQLFWCFGKSDACLHILFQPIIPISQTASSHKKSFNRVRANNTRYGNT